MASILPGFEYDIFISYRQKDNKGDRWVSEFVDALKTELESTFKEEISVYFDINPHDGLLETHDVNASLKDKLKCLIFIPIISRTYCDPKSFAWENELKEFVGQASQHKFGLKVKLSGGNVANRILPIQIHDLDADDKALLEKELGGILRPIEFIYKEPGVNKPLSSEDDEKKNLNNTKYKIQINKVANAINEIICGLKSVQTTPLKNESIQGNPYADVKKEERKEPINKAIFNQKSKKWMKILLFVFLCVASAYAIYKIIDHSKQTKDLTKLEKSIAVLPFKSLSDDPEKQYLADGTMDAILLHLSKIEDLRVMSRTSVEQYRKTDKTSNVIGQELGVAYLLEGSFQKYGDNARLIVQLIKTGKEGHIWAKDYDRNWNDVFSVQSEVSQTIARELHAVITPEEKQIIEKIPTKNLTAYDFYQKGRDEYTKYLIDNNNRAALQRAEDFYHKALKYDAIFAQAYSGLAIVYWDKHYLKEKEYLSENFMDSVLVFANIALSFDDQLAEAYFVRGRYYAEKGLTNQAIEEFDKSIKFNPNDWMAYFGKGYLYSIDDLITSIENLQKAASLNHGSELPLILFGISNSYLNAGFIEKAKDYAGEAFKLVGDTTRYLWYLGEIEYCQSNFEKALEFLRMGYLKDSTNVDILSDLGFCYSYTDQFKESLKYFKKYVRRKEALGQFDLQGTQRIGYSYSQNGYNKEAKYYYDKQIEYCMSSIQNSRPYALSKEAYFDLAGVYAFKGDKEKAYENLKIFNLRQKMPLWMVTFIKDDPLFNSIRNEPEYQRIVSDVEAKYRAEHERVRKWLEENGML